MTRINVYLAKSNRSDPTTVSRVRTFLKNHPRVLNVIEYSGGPYNHKDLTSSDFVVFITEPGTNVIGKGLYGQIKECFDKGIEFILLYTGKTIPSAKYAISKKELSLKDTINSDDFVNYSSFTFNTHSVYSSTDEALVKNIGRRIDIMVNEKKEQFKTKENIEISFNSITNKQDAFEALLLTI